MTSFTSSNSRIFGLLLSMLLIMQNTIAQNTDPVAVVQQQLDAYNRQDVQAFAATFAENAELYNQVGDTVPVARGRAAIADRYGKLFAQYPKNKSTLLGRMIQGNFVIDHEWITGREKETKIVAIYEVLNGQISRAWFIR